MMSQYLDSLVSALSRIVTFLILGTLASLAGQKLAAMDSKLHLPVCQASSDIVERVSE